MPRTKTAAASRRDAFHNEWIRYESSEEAMRLAPSTMTAKRRMWRHFSGWILSAHPEVSGPKDVTRAIAAEYIAAHREGRAAMTTNIRVCILKEVFRVIFPEMSAKANPWAAFRVCAGDGHRRRELSSDEMRRLMVVAAKEKGEWSTLFAIAIYTGLRLGDCCRLRWESIDFERRIISVVPAKTSRFGGKTVTIPIHSELMTALLDAASLPGTGFVMPAIALDFRERRWRVSRGLSRIFQKAGIRTGVAIEGRNRLAPDATFHSLRHSFVSIATDAGAPLSVVQSLVGHSTAAMTSRYYHAGEDAKRRAVDAIPPIGSRRRSGRQPSCRHTLAFRIKRLSRKLRRFLDSTLAPLRQTRIAKKVVDFGRCFM